MVKRNFAATVAVLMACLLVNSANAKEIPVGIDGCTVLARAVYTEVSAAALHGPGRSGPWLLDAGQGDISVCRRTAETVSRAFTSAMRSAGFAVRWRDEHLEQGDYCLSGVLSECYPNRGPRTGLTPSARSSFVQTTWSIVSRSVMRQMYNPYSSDEVRFRDGDLKLQIGLSLRTVRTREVVELDVR